MGNMLHYLVTTLHIIVCIILVLVVLLQSGKGADLAGAFGGGSTQTAFGSRGPASFLSKMTTIAAIIFMLTSIGLSMISTKTAGKSVLDNGVVEETAAPEAKTPGAESPDEPALTQEQINRRVEELKSMQEEQSNSEESIPAPEAEAP